MQKQKKIFKSTLILYFRQAFVVLVSLYTVRVALGALGIEGYGIYTVVAGVVTLCSFLTGTMSSATQRYISYALGKDDINLLKYTFSSNLVIYICMVIIGLIVLESIGLWFVKDVLILPQDMMSSAISLYHYSVFSFLFSFSTAPFVAIIIAHEDMKYFAYISIFESILRLLAVSSLEYIPMDKLELYALLVLLVSSIVFLVYLFTCSIKYSEVQFKRFYFDKNLFKEMFNFAGWSLFGAVTNVIRNQAVTILLNQFFNPATAAARAIAVAISSQINLFSNNFNTALYPEIIKNYAKGNNKELNLTVIEGSKLTFFLMWIFSLPLLFEMQIVLDIWLEDVPANAVLFSQLALIEVLLVSISLPLSTAARAPGKMKQYETILGVMQIFILILSYLFLRLGYEAYSVFIVAIIINILMFVVRLILLSRLIKFSISTYLYSALIPIAVISSTSLIFTYAFKLMLPDGLIFSIVNVVASMIITTILMFYIGLNIEYKVKIKDIIYNKYLNIFQKG